mgnify:CR=1 FL=1
MLHIIQVGNIVLSPDIITEYFCCDLDACKGICCVEGDSGAPLTEEEVGELENVLPEVENELTDKAREVIREQGVAYVDQDGDLVTSIVRIVFSLATKTAAVSARRIVLSAKGAHNGANPFRAIYIPFAKSI